MSTDKLAVSNDEITSMVRQTLVGQDLSKITGKMVRERIINQLGDRIQPHNFAAIKAAVKASLNIVLHDPNPPTSNTRATETHAAPKPHPAQSAPQVSPHEHTRKSDHPVRKTEPPNPESDGSGRRAQTKPRSKKRPRKVLNSDSESCSGPEPQPKPARKKNSASSVQKRAEAQSNPAAVRRLDQLKKLCRQLGCPVPPAKLRGTDPRDKIDNIVQYLQSKGVRCADPLGMSSREISQHRNRIAKEKDLEGLDMNNIIEEEGRSRRRVSKTKKQLSDKLPSDLSGEDFAEDSESAESEGYAAPSDDSE